MDVLLSPTRFGAWSLRNHVVMAPCTRGMSPRFTPGPDVATYYARRAADGVGLIITEGTVVDARGCGYRNVPGLFADEHVRAWRGVTDAVHAAGGVIVCQLWHCGAFAHPLTTGGLLPEGPSGLSPRGVLKGLRDASGAPVPFGKAEAMSARRILEVIEAFGAAARNALRAGFDGVEIHGAHGYLIDQFTNLAWNRRDDGYGGEARARFAGEVARRVIDIVGPDRTIFRFSPAMSVGDVPWLHPKETLALLCHALQQAGVQLLHASHPRYDEPVVPGADGALQPLHRATRALWSGQIIGVGDLTPERADAALRDREVDLCAFGRPILANPDFVRRLERRAPLRPYTPMMLARLDDPPEGGLGEMALLPVEKAAPAQAGDATTLGAFIDLVARQVDACVRSAALDEDQRALLIEVVAAHRAKVTTPASDPTALFFWIARAWRSTIDEAGVRLGAFCLIAFLAIDLFDDVQDDDLADSPFARFDAPVGRAIAINTALTLFAMASHVLHRAFEEAADAAHRARLAEEYARMTFLSSRGQHRDLLSGARRPTPAEVMTSQREKASLIVFIAVSAALYARLPPLLVERYRGIAERFCVLLQILDDLRDIFGKAQSPDLSTGKMSFPLSAFRASAPRDAVDALDEAVRALPASLPDVQRLLYDHGAVTQSAEAIEALRRELHREIAATGNGAEAHVALVGLVDGLAAGLYRLRPIGETQALFSALPVVDVASAAAPRAQPVTEVQRPA